MFFQEFYSFRSYISAFNPFWVDFCVWCEIRIWFHFCVHGYLVFSTPFVEETILSPLCILGTFVEDHLALYIWIYYSVLYSVPLAYVFIFMQVPYSFDHQSFIVWFFKDFIYLFLERGGWRETSMCGCISRGPHWGPGPQPRHVPWLGIELVALWFTARAQSTELYQPGLDYYLDVSFSYS